MKKTLFAISFIILLLGTLRTIDSVQADNILWKLSSGNVQPVSSGWGLSIPQLGGSGVKCIHVDNSGNVSTSSADCGTGSGGSSTVITVNNTSGTSFAITGDNITTTSTVNGTTTVIKLVLSGVSSGSYNCANITVSSSGIITSAVAGSCSGGGATTTIQVSTTTLSGPAFTLATSTSPGVWNIAASGTSAFKFTIPPANDQYFAPSTTIPTNDNQLTNGAGYITSTPAGVATTTIAASGTTLNGNAFTFGSTTIIQPYVSGTALYWLFLNPGYITTSTGLGTANFATTSVSQWNNDAHYVTSTGAGSPTTTINQASGPTFNFTIATGTQGIATSTSGGSSTIAITVAGNLNQYTNGPGFITSYTTTTPAGNNGTFQYDSTNLFAGAGEMVYNTSTQQTRFTAQTTPAYGVSISTGGIVNITGTNTTSSALVVYSNQASPSGRLVVFNCDTAYNGQDCFLVENQATGSTALNVQSWAAGKGAIKIDHNQPTDGSSDANASALSVALNGTSSQAQGIFLDSASGTSGNLLEIRNKAVTQFRLSSSGVPTFKGVVSALHVADSNGLVSAYGGSNCTAGSSATGVSATGTVACQTTSTILSGYVINGTSTSPLFNNVNASGTINASTSITINGVAVSTSTPSSLAGTYLGTSGNTLVVSSTLASSSFALNISNPTTTNATTNFGWKKFIQKFTFSSISCYDTSGGTTTLWIYRNSTLATTTAVSNITSSTIACGISGNTTTTFQSSTMNAGDYLYVMVTSTAGTSLQANVSFDGTKF